jgi:hypothetical protein
MPETTAITVTPYSPDDPGALPGWQVTCECGARLTTSLSNREAEALAQEHREWHVRAEAVDVAKVCGRRRALGL